MTNILSHITISHFSIPPELHPTPSHSALLMSCLPVTGYVAILSEGLGDASVHSISQSTIGKQENQQCNVSMY